MLKKSIVIINQWNDEMTCYEKYVDHDKYDVIYIANQCGAKAIKNDKAKYVYVTNNLDILDQDNNLIPFLKQIKKIDRVIAFSEVDQELAAAIRTHFSISGTNAKDVIKFRNKIEMKNVSKQAKINVPHFIDLADDAGLDELINITGFPLILKPKYGVSSEGVLKIHDLNELDATLQTINHDHYECEQFISGTIYHADGFVHDNKIVLFKVSEYINTCFEYTKGLPLGSVVIDDPVIEKEAIIFTKHVVKSFALNQAPFHLEFIKNNDNKIYFLELGARVGGAKVPHVFKNIYGINLFHLWVDAQMGNDIAPHLNLKSDNYLGGWLLFPEPKNLPCKVKSSCLLKSAIPQIKDEYVPAIGHVFYGGGEYRDVSGAYLYHGRKTDEIKDAIKKTIQKFSIQMTLI